jgi:hypothetical protein
MVEKKHDDEDDDSLSLSLGFFTLKLTGAMLAVFLPYAGWALLIMALAYGATVVIGAMSK